jgi:hypothetical protein
VRRRRELRRARGCDALVLSRAKSGRTWLRAMLSRLYQHHYGLPERELLEYDNFHRARRELPRIFFTHGHYLQDEVARADFRQASTPLIFLVRNPLDVAVSEYFQSTRRASGFKRELHGVADIARGADDRAAMFDFVMHAPVGLPSIIDYLNAWEPLVRALPRHLVLRYEDLRADPEAGLASASALLGAPFSRDEVAEAVEFTSFERLKEKERTDFYGNSRLAPRDPDDPDSFKVRRGKVGGYRDYFDAEQIGRMEELVHSKLDASFGYRAPV